MISAIQILLITGILSIGIYWYKRSRSSYIDSIIIFILLITALLFVAFPQFSTKVASLLGVGRGVDMIFYISHLFLAFIVLKLYLKVRKLNEIITKIVRTKAIEESIKMKDY